MVAGWSRGAFHELAVRITATFRQRIARCEGAQDQHHHRCQCEDFSHQKASRGFAQRAIDNPRRQGALFGAELQPLEFSGAEAF
jgi:hypothetical protein